MTRTSLFVWSLILSATTSQAQTDSVKYTPDFIFKEGIYVTIDDFKKNKPNLTPENFKQYNPDIEYLDENFFENKGLLETSRRQIFYPDSAGSIQEQTADSLFGYTINGRLYIIRHKDLGIGFIVLRTFRFGTISFCFEVSANSTINDEILGIRMRRGKMGHNSLIPGSDRSSNNQLAKARQYLMDFKTGKTGDFNVFYFEKFLREADADLHKEFSKISPTKKKKMMFVYLNKVNDKHPIYFKN